MTSFSAISRYGLFTTTWNVGSPFSLSSPGCGSFLTTTKQKPCHGSFPSSTPFPTALSASSGRTFADVLRYFHVFDQPLQK